MCGKYWISASSSTSSKRPLRRPGTDQQVSPGGPGHPVGRARCGSGRDGQRRVDETLGEETLGLQSVDHALTERRQVAGRVQLPRLREVGPGRLDVSLRHAGETTVEVHQDPHRPVGAGHGLDHLARGPPGAVQVVTPVGQPGQEAGGYAERAEVAPAEPSGLVEHRMGLRLDRQQVAHGDHRHAQLGARDQLDRRQAARPCRVPGRREQPDGGRHVLLQPGLPHTQSERDQGSRCRIGHPFASLQLGHDRAPVTHGLFQRRAVVDDEQPKHGRPDLEPLVVGHRQPRQLGHRALELEHRGLRILRPEAPQRPGQVVLRREVRVGWQLSDQLEHGLRLALQREVQPRVGHDRLRPADVVAGQRVPGGPCRVAVQPPPRRPQLRFERTGWVLVLASAVHVRREHWVPVVPPVVVVVPGERDEQVLPLALGEESLRVVAPGDRVDQLRADVAVDGGREDELPEPPWQPLEHLPRQVVRQRTVPGGERAHERRDVVGSPEGERRHTDAGGPAFGGLVQGGRLRRPEGDPGPFEQQRRLLRGEDEVPVPQEGDLPGQPEPLEGQGRVRPGGQDDVERRRPPAQQPVDDAHRLGRVGDLLDVVKDQQKRLVDAGKGGEERIHEALGVDQQRRREQPKQAGRCRRTVGAERLLECREQIRVEPLDPSASTRSRVSQATRPKARCSLSQEDSSTDLPNPAPPASSATRWSDVARASRSNSRRRGTTSLGTRGGRSRTDRPRSTTPVAFRTRASSPVRQV